jgi:hypothetical protein
MEDEIVFFTLKESAKVDCHKQRFPPTPPPLICKVVGLPITHEDSQSWLGQNGKHKTLGYDLATRGKLFCKYDDSRLRFPHNVATWPHVFPK